jgi:HEAT repeat protein/ATP/ADP translocase
MKHSPSLAAIFNIREGEGRPLVLLLIHSFFLGITMVLYDTGASALFLDAFDIDTLPYVYLCAAVVVPVVGIVYSKFEARVSLSKLLTGNLLFLIFFTGMLWGLLKITTSKWPVLALFIWLEVITVLYSLEFWGLAGQIFNVRQGKRLFGLIGSGEVAAGILAGLSAGFIASLIGTENLIFCSVVSLVFSACMMRHIIKSFPDSLGEREDEAEGQDVQPIGVAEVLKSRYLLLILSISAISVVGFYFVDFAFYDCADYRYQGSEALAGFFGLFFALGGIFNLISRAFISGRLLSRYGLSLGLLALPAILIFGNGIISVVGTVFSSAAVLFFLIVMTKLFDEVVRPTIEEPSILILYQPLPARQRIGIQIIVESIIEPIGIGIAGVLLIILTGLFNFTAVHAAYVMIGILIVWGAVALWLRKEYTRSLMRALEKRILGGASLSLKDASSLEILKRGLKSPHAGEVIYSLNMLEDIEHDSLEVFLVDLTAHPDPFIRKDVLSRIGRLKMAGAIGVVSARVDVEEDAGVKGAALRTLCELGETDVFETVLPFLDDRKPDVKKGAMVGMLRSGGIEGVLAAGEYLIGLVKSPLPQDRRFGAEILGDVEIRSFYRPLITLLADQDTTVKKAAVAAAGRLCNPRLWPMVIESLALTEVYETAFSALICGGDGTLKCLEERFLQAEDRYDLRLRIIQVIGKIKSPRCIEFLFEHMDVPDSSLRYRILTSLSACGFQADPAQKKILYGKIFEEIRTAAWHVAALVDIGETEEFDVLSRALRDNIDRTIERIMFMLSYVYPAKAVLQARESLNSGSPEKRAYAIEALDNLLTQEVKSAFLPLIDNIGPVERLNALECLGSQKMFGKNERLRAVVLQPIEKSSAWLKSCALYILGRMGDEDHTEVVAGALSDDHQMVRETAVWALGRIGPADLAERIGGYVDDPSGHVARMAGEILQIADGPEHAD